jgi:prepilin-type N-terminal cleavage/methylation domain-containing protein
MNRQPNTRYGFSLVEILVAITVIAILGGMLMAGLFPVLRRAREAATFTELKQIETSIENFKTKYGFYPPSFIQFHNLDAVGKTALMRRYLNRISPNHQESDARIQAWFAACGNNINPNLGQDITFWLSGLFKNKQFPLTGSAAGAIAPAFSVPATANDLREIFYEFKPERLFDSAGTLPPVTTALVAGFSQLDNVVSPLVYIDSANYTTEVTGTSTLNTSNWPASRRRNVGYFRRVAPANVLDVNPIALADLNANTVAFENPTTFQLFFSGTDTTCGNTDCVSGFNIRNMPAVDSDNIANFANGRMDAYANSLTN